MIGHFNGFIKQLERGTQFECEQPGSLGKALRDETNMVAREKLQSQSKLLGHFCVFSSNQC